MRKLIIILLMNHLNIAKSLAAEPIKNEKYEIQNIKAVYEEADSQLKSLLKNYSDFEKKYNDAIKIQYDFESLYDKYEKVNKDKKKDESEVSIIEAQLNQMGEKRKIAFKNIKELYPIPMYALLDLRKEKKSLSRVYLENAVAKYKKNGLGYELPSHTCFSEKEGISLDKKCIKPALELCTKTLSFEGEGLFSPVVNSELEVVKVPFSSAEEYSKFFKIDDEVNSIKELDLKIDKSIYSTCDILAKKKFKFNRKKISFDKELPKWAEAYIKKSHDVTWNSVNEKCFNPKDAPKDFYRKINALTASYKLVYPLDEIEKILSACKMAVNEVCKNTRLIQDKIVFSYWTNSCQIRSVTNNDVESDIQKWKASGLEEGKIAAHSEILDMISFCKNANDSGYTWTSKQPESNDCKLNSK